MGIRHNGNNEAEWETGFADVLIREDLRNNGGGEGPFFDFETASPAAGSPWVSRGSGFASAVRDFIVFAVIHAMRLFVAIKASDAWKDALVNVQRTLYENGMRGRYTSMESFHVTLAFIGEVAQAEPVMDALSIVRFTPFSLTLDGIGCFRDLWWAGLQDSVPLTAVARRVRRALAEGDIPFDRKRFSPHITLLRKASGSAAGIRIPPVEMNVESISLMRSDRGKNGMIYTEIGRIDAGR